MEFVVLATEDDVTKRIVIENTLQLELNPMFYWICNRRDVPIKIHSKRYVKRVGKRLENRGKIILMPGITLDLTGLAGVRVQRADGDHGAGMGRHHPVHDREKGNQRKGQRKEGAACLAGQSLQHRQEQEEAHGKPGTEADGDGQRNDAPAGVVLPEKLAEAPRKNRGAA